MSDIPKNWLQRFSAGSKGKDPGQAEAKVPVEWKIGDVILDLYEVKQIHEGGMGLVYRVHHRGWNIDLAVKTPRADFLKTQQQKDNFVRECETWVNLGLHPHIVSCFYVRTLGGIPRIFAEYVEGGSLKDWVDSRRLYEGGPKKAPERILDIVIQMSWGLQYAHEKGLVHQDVKPANVMIMPESSRGSEGSLQADFGQAVNAKITDFGLAKARVATGEKYLTGSGRTILVSAGYMTPAYCSPEQGQGAPLSHRTDIWSWAVSVLEMFTGVVTWIGQAAAETLERFLETDKGQGIIPRMPDTLGRLLRWCFRRNPAERPNSFREVAASLLDLYREQFGEEYGRTEPKAADLSADSLNNRALSLLDLVRPDQAERAWEEALAEHKGHLESTYNLGLLMWRGVLMDDSQLLGRLSESAIGVLEDWRGAVLRARVHLERGDCESVIKELGRLTQPDSHRKDVVQVVHSARELLKISRRCLRTFEEYAQTGHGGDIALKSRDPSDYQVSILEVAGTASSVDEIKEMESRWKAKLRSREMGLNRN
jgi:serine/threonine protein kinase